ncbi:hypothetical protein V1477_006567 [Vespula maculifrons]|uniref:Uncharacterized protein n=1 Tax=Vespula maculifrons TaxID=7453 RepID=A0ABD2CK80_VESMC
MITILGSIFILEHLTLASYKTLYETRKKNLHENVRKIIYASSLHPFACKPIPTSRSAYDSWCLAIVRGSSSTEMLADVAATAIAAAITIGLESDCSAKQQSLSPAESTYRDSSTSLAKRYRPYWNYFLQFNTESVFLVFAKVAPGVIVCQAARRNNSRLRYQPFRPTLLPSPSTSSPSSISPSIVSKLLPDQPINVVEEILWRYFTIIAIKGHFADEE